MNPNIYVFLHPNDKHRASKLGFGSCLLGWKTEKDALLCPKKKTKCDLLHVDVSLGCGGTEEIIIEEVKKLGAKGVFLDADEVFPDAEELTSFLVAQGLSVFTSFETKTSASLVETEKGKNRLICPRAQKTSILLSGKSIRSRISRSDLEALIQRLCPKESYSEELGSYYFSSKSKNETLFVVYDTPQTFRERLHSCKADNIFITMASVNEYLTEGK